MPDFIPPDRWEFIWASYIIFFVTLLIMVVIPFLRSKSLRKELNEYYQRKELLAKKRVSSDESQSDENRSE